MKDERRQALHYRAHLSQALREVLQRCDQGAVGGDLLWEIAMQMPMLVKAHLRKGSPAVRDVLDRIVVPAGYKKLWPDGRSQLTPRMKQALAEYIAKLAPEYILDRIAGVV